MSATRKFMLLPVLAMLVLAGAACGGGGKSAQTAVKTGLKGSGFEQIKAVNGSVDDSGRLTVVGENGSKVDLEVVKEGGKFIIQECFERLVKGSSCTNVPEGQPLEP